MFCAMLESMNNATYQADIGIDDALKIHTRIQQAN